MATIRRTLARPRNATTLQGEVRVRGRIRASWARCYEWRVLCAAGLLGCFVSDASALDGDEMAETLAAAGLVPAGTSGDALLEALASRRSLDSGEAIDEWERLESARFDAYLEALEAPPF